MKLTDDQARWALFVMAIACPLVLCAITRPIEPAAMPALRLPSDAVRAQIASDEQAARGVPKTDAQRELERSFLEYGKLEVAPLTVHGDGGARKRALHDTYARLVKSEGLDVALALRARATDLLEAALALKLPKAESDAALGLFPNAIAGYHLTLDGEPQTAHFVLRTFYKARWNKLMGVDAAFALTPIEQRAYHGYLALHADNRSADERMHELALYAVANGEDVDEARGVLAYSTHDYVHAVEAFVRATESQPSLRVQNHLAAARLALEVSEPGRRATAK